MSERNSLAMPDFDVRQDDLEDFAPRRAGQGRLDAPHDPRRAIDSVSQFPSREPALDVQLNLKGPRHVVDRFRAMCKADRRAYYDMLEILMDAFEKDKSD